MRTNIEIDDDLIAKAIRLTGVRTKREAVALALQTLVAERERRDIRDLRGAIRFRKGYDAREARTR